MEKKNIDIRPSTLDNIKQEMEILAEKNESENAVVTLEFKYYKKGKTFLMDYYTIGRCYRKEVY